MLIDRLASFAADRTTHASSDRNLSRRTFLTASAAAGGGLLLGVAIPSWTPTAGAAAAVFTPNAFIRIARDGRVTLVMPYVEMGQGTYTSISMLLAEELEVGLDQVQVEHAPADRKLYGNPLVAGDQATGGSTAVRASWEPMRRAGATARAMLMSAAAAEWQVDAAACRAERGTVIHDASNRRIAYGELVDRAAALPVPDKVTLKDPRDFRLIGTPAKRIDAAGKVNGTAEYGIDVKLPGMKIATVATCPVFGGKLASVDDSKAKAINGVRQIVRLADAVAVVADHMGAARKGLEALAITWDAGANAHLSTADIVGQLAAAAQKPSVVGPQAGDVDAAMKAAATTVEAVYQLPLLAHATMEPVNCTVHLRPDACDVWVGIQVAARARDIAAATAGLPVEKVAIHNHLIGGGFGRRLEVDFIPQAIRIAQQVDGPVKVIWTREEDIQHDIYRPYYYDALAAGLDASGAVVGFSHRVVGSSIVARWLPPAFKDGFDFDAVDGAAGPYDFSNLHVDYVRQEPPAGLTTGWWRGVGITHNAFMVEGFIDELAAKSGKDPVDYRRALLDNALRARGVLDRAADAHRRAMVDRARRARGVLDLAAEKAGWGTPMPAGSGRGVALLFGFGTYMAQVAEVAVGKDGQVRVQRVVCAVDCGMVVNPDTVQAQIQGGIMFGISAALYGAITIKDGRVEQSNFDSYQVLRINEAPAVDVHIVKSSEAPGGMGEPATSAVSPAIVNAIFAATGKRLRQLPIDAAQLKSV